MSCLHISTATMNGIFTIHRDVRDLTATQFGHHWESPDSSPDVAVPTMKRCPILNRTDSWSPLSIDLFDKM